MIVLQLQKPKTDIAIKIADEICTASLLSELSRQMCASTHQTLFVVGTAMIVRLARQTDEHANSPVCIFVSAKDKEFRELAALSPSTEKKIVDMISQILAAGDCFLDSKQILHAPKEILSCHSVYRMTSENLSRFDNRFPKTPTNVQHHWQRYASRQNNKVIQSVDANCAIPWQMVFCSVVTRICPMFNKFYEHCRCSSSFDSRRS